MWGRTLSSILERFNESLPWWVQGIKQESFKKIWQSTLLQDCKNTNHGAMRILMIRFWPFVDEFPKIIKKHQQRIFVREFLRHPILISFLSDTVSKILEEIRGDETNHRSLWLDTSSALGLNEGNLYLNTKKDFNWLKVRDTIDKVGEPVSILGNKVLSSTALLRLAAVEIVAEGISLYVRDEFKKVSDSAGRWFETHIYHQEDVMSHEELVYRIAFAFDNKKPERDKVNVIIQEVVDLFIEAGEVSY